MFAQLGSIVFSGMKSLNSLSTTFETNLVEHALIENKPTLQRVGLKLDVLSISMLFHADFCNPQEEIDRLNEAMNVGEVMPFLMGDGRLAGEYLIKNIKVNESHHDDLGFLYAGDVQVELLEFFDFDRPATVKTAAVKRGFAMQQNRPGEFIPVPVPETPQAVASASVIGANASATTAAVVLDTLPDYPSQYRPKAEDIVQLMLRTGDSIAEVFSVVNADPASELYSMTRSLVVNCNVMVSVVNDVVAEAESLISDIDAGNTAGIPAHIVALVQKSVEVKNRCKNIMSSASQLNAYTVVQ